MEEEHVFRSAVELGTRIGNELRLFEKWQARTGEARTGQSIFDACRRDDVARVREILKEDPFAANLEDFAGNTPVQVACMLRCYATVEVLLEHGADLLRPDPIGIPALLYVNDAVAKAKIQRVADAYCGDDGNDYLDDDSTIANSNGNAIRDAAYNGDMATLEQLLLQEPALLSSRDKKGHTPLIYACMGQQSDTACFLLEKGADLYATTSYGWQAARYLTDAIKREKVLNFAFKVSPEGKAQARQALMRRNFERRLAISDSTYTVMEDIRAVIMERSRVLRERAQALSDKARQKATDYIEIGTLRAVESSVREFMDLHERLAEEERLRLIAEEEEKVRVREAFIAESVARVLAEREAAAAAAAEREHFRLLALAEEERLRMRLEAAHQAKQLRQQQLIAEMTARAEDEFTEMMAEEKAAAWAAFRKTRPARVKHYKRMVKSVSEASKLS